MRSRRLFTFFSVLSLLLCVAVCGSWIYSYSPPRTAAPRELPAGRSRFECRRGQFLLARHRANPERPRVWTTVFLPASGAGNGALVRAAVFAAASPVDPRTGLPAADLLSRPYGAAKGVAGHRLSNGGGFGLSLVRLPGPGAELGTVFWVAAVPHWCLALFFAVLPARWLLKLIRRRRTSLAGLCHQCGYDLRATPGRCPECGAEPAVR